MLSNLNDKKTMELNISRCVSSVLEFAMPSIMQIYFSNYTYIYIYIYIYSCKNNIYIYIIYIYVYSCSFHLLSSFQEIWVKFEMSDTFRDADNNSKAYGPNALEIKTGTTSSGSTEIGATKIADGGAEKTPGTEVELKERGQKKPKLHLLPKKPPHTNRAMWELKNFTLLHTFKVDFSRQRRRILKEDHDAHDKIGTLEKGLEDLMQVEFPDMFEQGETTSHDAVAALDSLISKSKLTVEQMEQEVGGLQTVFRFPSEMVLFLVFLCLLKVGIIRCL